MNTIHAKKALNSVYGTTANIKDKFYVYNPCFEEIDGPFSLRKATEIQKSETKWPAYILMKVIDEHGNGVK